MRAVKVTVNRMSIFCLVATGLLPLRRPSSNRAVRLRGGGVADSTTPAARAEEGTAYAVLQVERTAPAEDIKKAYRQAALRWHPDKFRERDDIARAEEKLKDINWAYSILSDPVKRHMHDFRDVEATVQKRVDRVSQAMQESNLSLPVAVQVAVELLSTGCAVLLSEAFSLGRLRRPGTILVIMLSIVSIFASALLVFWQPELFVPLRLLPLMSWLWEVLLPATLSSAYGLSCGGSVVAIAVLTSQLHRRVLLSVLRNEEMTKRVCKRLSTLVWAALATCVLADKLGLHGYAWGLGRQGPIQRFLRR